jgi:hypothetical protein
MHDDRYQGNIFPKRPRLLAFRLAYQSYSKRPRLSRAWVSFETVRYILIKSYSDLFEMLSTES